MVFLNARRFIDEAIKSVEAQTFTDWELVLVDDGSDDGSNELAAELCRRRSGPDTPRAASGSRESRYRRVAQPRPVVCRGEFVAFLDADDVYLPQRLETHVALLERHPEVALVQSCVQQWHSWSGGKDGRRVDVRRAGATRADATRQSIRRTCWC